MFVFTRVTFNTTKRCLFSQHGTSVASGLLKRSNTPTQLNFYSKGARIIPPHLSKYLKIKNPKLSTTSYQQGEAWNTHKNTHYIKPSATEKIQYDDSFIHMQQRRLKYFSKNIKPPLANTFREDLNGQENTKSKVLDSMVPKNLTEEPQENAEEEAKRKKSEASWKKIKYSFMALAAAITCGLSYGIVYFGKPKINDYGEEIMDQYSGYPPPLEYIYRAINEVNYYNKLIKEPSRDKLLPDVLKPPYYQPPYTLVLEFTDVLVHPEWTYKTGWRFKKRPGLDQFLEALYTHYEMVVYTAEMGMTVFPIMEALDTNNLISYKLVRDATNFVGGHHVKDLDKLNRDLSKVIVIDWNPKSAQMHTENLFKLTRWNGNDDDTDLYDLTSFLLAISTWNVEDVRTVLEHYREYENPLANFKERQKILASTQQI